MTNGMKDTERLLRFSHATIEQAVDGILWLDSEGHLCRVNKSLCRMLEYSQEELLSLTVHEIAPSYQEGDFWVFRDRALSQGGVQTSEEPMQTKGGRIFPAEVTVNFIEFEGCFFGCAFIRDVSEKKHREEVLKNTLGELERLKKRLEAENIYLQEEIKVEHNFREILGGSNEFKAVLQLVGQVAPTDTTVLILGETGTGKELLARAVHNLSLRKDRPLVKVNCAALPPSLIESELFGHERGAFTGAFARKIGRFELADKGAIFLDEIGDLPMELQAKLLRVLQEGEFERVGGATTLKVDVRVIAATNRDLNRLIEENRFREDLFYRLNVFPIKIPPLRERKDDIPELVKFFVQKFGPKMGKDIKSISQKVIEILQEYDWPGNVRELENIIERSMVVCQGVALTVGDFSQRPVASSKTLKSASLKKVERDYIVEILESTHWRVSGEKGAAKILGLNPKTLESRMKKLGIKRP